jgi:hypothetical protein
MSKFLRPNKASLKNGQHFSFMQAFVTVLEQQGFTASKITALKTQLLAAFEAENNCYMLARTSELIAQRDEADRRRDNYYSRLHAIVRAWAESGDPDMEAAANVLIKVFKLYKLKTSAQMDDETGVMENLITDLSTTANLAHMATLHVSWLFQQMCQGHEDVKSIRLQEGAEVSERELGALVTARKECDRLYDELTYLIEAFEKTADDAAPYTAFISLWNGTLKIYQDMLDRKSSSNSSSSSSSQQGGTTEPSGEQGGTTENGENGGSTENGENGQNGGDNGGGDNGGDDNGGGDNGGGDLVDDPDAD